MIDELLITNETLGISLTMDRDDSDYLIDDNGLNWGEISSKFSTLSNFDGFGAALNAIETTDPREVHIVGWVVGTESEMAIKKSYLAQVLSPQSSLKIIVNSKRSPGSQYYLRVYTSKTVSFGTEMKTNNEKMCQFEVTFSALYPFFEQERSYSNLSSGDRILNLGAIPVGVNMILTMTSAVTDPYIILKRGRHEYGFGAYGTFNSGAKLYVNTQYSAREFTIDGQKAYYCLNTAFSWIMVPVSYNDTDYISVTMPAGISAELSYCEAYTSMEDL